MLDSLDTLDRTFTFSKPAFKAVQRDLLERIAALSELIYEQKRAAIIVLEGWDAAGKGTTIRALTERLDARGYKVLSTQAPRTHEKQKPWLWRFWMNIPRYGQIAIFDRSWYGRVLVERVRGLTPLPEWIAAYEEINQFERTLADDGTIILKFWLHISRREQLRRFVNLTQDPATSWQVTAEDWENHRLYDEYVAAVRDMLANTNTPYAPWAAIDATSRDFRIYTVARTLIARLEEALAVPPSHWPEIEELQAAGDGGAKKAKADKGLKDAKHPKEVKREKKQDQGEGEPKPKDKAKKKDKDKKKKPELPAAAPLAVSAVGEALPDAGEMAAASSNGAADGEEATYA